MFRKSLILTLFVYAVGCMVLGGLLAVHMILQGSGDIFGSYFVPLSAGFGALWVFIHHKVIETALIQPLAESTQKSFIIENII